MKVQLLTAILLYVVCTAKAQRYDTTIGYIKYIQCGLECKEMFQLAMQIDSLFIKQDSFCCIQGLTSPPVCLAKCALGAPYESRILIKIITHKGKIDLAKYYQFIPKYMFQK